METLNTQVCPFCKTEIQENDPVTVCPDCGAAHHQHCFDTNHGCANPECASKRVEMPQDSVDYCKNCGTAMDHGQPFCPACGAPNAQAAQNPGIDLSSFQQAAPTAQPKKSKVGLIIGISAAAVVLILLIVLVVFPALGIGENFNTMFSDEYGGKSWCTISSDGSYMRIDTNPTNKDSDDLTLTDYYSVMLPANDAIEEINEELGFSSSVYDDMQHTTALQGKQSATSSDGKYKVTWSYHPDKGLEVKYEFNR